MGDCKHLTSKCQKGWSVPASDMAKKSFNPVRKFIEQKKRSLNPEKSMITLSIGDPTVSGNLNPPVEAKEAVIDVILGTKGHGYAPSVGYETSRKAIADRYT